MPNKHFAGPDVALFRQRRVADARELPAVLALELAARGVELPVTVRVVDHVVEIRQPLFAHEVAQDVHVAVGQAVGGENVVVGDDDDLVAIPDLGVAAELPVEHPDGPRSAHVMGQEDIGVDPDVVAGLDPVTAAGAGEDGFGEGHTGKYGETDYDTTAREVATGFYGVMPGCEKPGSTMAGREL